MRESVCKYVCVDGGLSRKSSDKDTPAESFKIISEDFLSTPPHGQTLSLLRMLSPSLLLSVSMSVSVCAFRYMYIYIGG